MIALEGVTVDIGGQVAVRDVDLAIAPGEVLALVGGDGAGKTTLLRLLAGRVHPSAGSTRGLDTSTIGVMPASGATFGDLTVAENLAFARAAHRLPDDDQQGLLHRMGLHDARDRLAGRLSGGMRQKLALAMALQPSPDLLLLDEPTTGVDPVSRAEIWQLLGQEVAGGTAVVMATTYLDEAARATRVLVLDEGIVVGSGTPEQVRAEMPGRMVGGPIPVPDAPSWRRGVRWHSWLAEGAADPPDACRPLDTDLEDAMIVAALRQRPELARGGMIAEQRARTPAAADDQQDGPDGRSPAARTEDVTRSFGPFLAVAGATLAVRPGEVVGLLGANGAGKTTLIRMLLGLLPPTSGTVELLGGPPDRSARRQIGYVPQGLGLYDDLTADQNIAFHEAAYGIHAGHRPSRPDGPDHAQTVVGRMPLGLQRQLAFEVATAHEPRLLVLDEPTSGVGPLGRARLWEQIRGAAERGTAVLVTTHHLAEAEQCDRLVVMAAGQVVASGTAHDIIGGREVVQVPTTQPARVLQVLGDDGLVAALSDGGVSVPGAQEAEVLTALRAAGLPTDVRTRRATLEERFVELATG